MATSRRYRPVLSREGRASVTGRIQPWGTSRTNIWMTCVVDNVVTNGLDTSMAFNAAGRPSIAYYDYQRDYVKYAYYNGTSWSLENTYTRFAKSLAMAFATNGWPSIAHVDSQSLKGNLLYHSRGLYSSWETEVTVEAIGSGSYDGSVGLAFAPDGRPAISYYDGFNKDLKYAKFNGVQWVRQVIDSVGDVGQYTSLAFSPRGRPAISYFDKTNGKLKVAEYVEGILVP